MIGVTYTIHEILFGCVGVFQRDIRNVASPANAPAQDWKSIRKELINRIVVRWLRSEGVNLDLAEPERSLNKQIVFEKISCRDALRRNIGEHTWNAKIGQGIVHIIARIVLCEIEDFDRLIEVHANPALKFDEELRQGSGERGLAR